MAVEDPVPPFGATVDGVKSLVPEARIVAADDLDEGQFGVTLEQVYEWVKEISGAVDITLDGWEKLSTDDDNPLYESVGVYDTGTYGDNALGDKGRFIEYARTVVHNGAASYLEAARHPERASVNADTYAAVLWERYTTGLDRLATWLADRLTSPEGDDDVTTDSSAAYSFPCPTFVDNFPV